MVIFLSVKKYKITVYKIKSQFFNKDRLYVNVVKISIAYPCILIQLSITKIC